MSSRSEVLTEMLRAIDLVHSEMMVTVLVVQTSSEFRFRLPACDVPQESNGAYGKAVLSADDSKVRKTAALALLGAAVEPTKKAPTSCERAILEVLEEKQERLSKGQILVALDDARTSYSESAVGHALAAMTRRKGWLTNRKDSYGKGYGLPDWS